MSCGIEVTLMIDLKSFKSNTIYFSPALISEKYLLSWETLYLIDVQEIIKSTNKTVKSFFIE